MPCDDGNSVSGDGCSSTCQLEAGWTCTGGSPTSKDVCSKAIPALKIISTGQSHIWGKVLLNIKLNYLPIALIQNANDCRSKCSNVLSVKITSGDSSAISIVSSYIPNTSFSFSVEISFGKEPFGAFSAQIGLSASIAAKYFSGVDTSQVLSVNVNPALFALEGEADKLTR